MNPKLRQQAVELTEQIMRTYYCQRDIYAILDWMAPEATWIGPGENEKKYTLDDIRIYFELGKEAIPSCEIFASDLRAVDLGEEYCLVIGSMGIHTVPGSRLILEVDQRVSFTFRFRGGKFQVIHMHISNPYGEMGKEEYFPHKIGSQSYQYLQQILREKTEVLDMITGNINGGLKGSNDDSTFSFFYVNEGLPGMLGFTYEEFMERTGGNAVGAVYPPDLPAALADCERCFSQGAVYSTEYRMEKKDGSLMWVLDSGRKVVDSEGITRINSIITDITPLKQALFDLEVERERYRIALEHITGAMCEYDAAEDIFTLYQQKNDHGAGTPKQVRLSHFSEEVCSGIWMSPEDGEEFLSRCMGDTDGFIELYTCIPNRCGRWYWVQFSCSVISDHSGNPLRAIGVLKDITEEKRRNLELMNQVKMDGLTGLLNQTASKKAIQTILQECAETAIPYTLFMVDLDQFKAVNDSNGHSYGDEVLAKTACILKETAGKEDIVGRIGGDEFIMLVKDAKQDIIAQMADTIVQKVREIGTEKHFHISCSIGIACRLHPKEQFNELFERADKALYSAKNDGRDRFFIG